MDTTKAYADLPDDIKQRCEGVVGNYEYVSENWAKGVPIQLMTMKGFGIVDPNILCLYYTKVLEAKKECIFTSIIIARFRLIQN